MNDPIKIPANTLKIGDKVRVSGGMTISQSSVIIDGKEYPVSDVVVTGLSAARALEAEKVKVRRDCIVVEASYKDEKAKLHAAWLEDGKPMLDYCDPVAEAAASQARRLIGLD